MKFIPKADKNLRTVYFSSGCFWGTEYYFMKAKGVKHTTVGFMGGHVENPSYEEVCRQNTGHLETTEVTFDTTKTSYEDLVKLFFTTSHRPTDKVPISAHNTSRAYSTPLPKKRL